MRPFTRTPVAAEVEDELTFHLEMTTRELIAQGLSPQQARAEAERRFGDMKTVNTDCRRYGTERDRDERRAEYREELRQDVVFAIRQLAKARGFSIVAILTLALGIGATAAVFSALDAVVLQPLPFEHPERIVELHTQRANQSNTPFIPEFFALRSSRVFEEVTATQEPLSLTMRIGDVSEVVAGGRVTANYFDVFKVRPELGRAFSPDEDAPGGPKVAVISHRFWVARFNADRGVVGRSLQLDGTPHAIIGVMPESFDFTRNTADVWVPLALAPSLASDFNQRFVRVYARLRLGQTMAQARAAASTVEQTVAQRDPSRTDPLSAFGVRLTPYRDQLIGSYGQLLLVFLGAVGFVLLIACTNVANLLLARATARTRELAIRAALGAGRARLTRQLLTECVVLGVAGAVASLGVAYALIRFILRLSPEGIPRIERATIDFRVLVFTLAVGLVSCLIFGLLPAIRAAGPQLQGALREGGRAGAGVSRDRLRGMLVVAEVSLAITLLVASGLLIRSAWLMQRVDPGFDPRGVLTARVALPKGRYDSAETITAAFRTIRAEVARIPGVQSAALVSMTPFAGSAMNSSIVPEGQPDDDRAPTANLRLMSPGYFETMRIPLLAGRDFATQDDASSRRVAVINKALAQRLWPNASLNAALGKRIVGPGTFEVVGVVADVHGESFVDPPKPEYYLPADQTPPVLWPMMQRSMLVVVKTTTPSADAMTMRRPVSQAVSRFDPSLPLANAITMEGSLRRSMARQRMNMLLLSLLGGIALTLAIIGIYGVVAYFVSQRTQEIGVRLALGATPTRIWRYIVRRGLTPIVAGLVIGFALSTLTTRVIERQLFGVQSHDPMTFGAVGGLLLLVGLLAIYVPARRAMRVSPAVALNDR